MEARRRYSPPKSQASLRPQERTPSNFPDSRPLKDRRRLHCFWLYQTSIRKKGSSEPVWHWLTVYPSSLLTRQSCLGLPLTKTRPGTITYKNLWRLYFLVQSKRAQIPFKDVMAYYSTCTRSSLDYACPLFHHAFPIYLQLDLERRQKSSVIHFSPASLLWSS